MKLKGGAMFG